MGKIRAALKFLMKGLIRLYQICISPFIGSHCRFYPNCSQYAITAIEVHGPIKGGWLALRRIGKCHPWNTGGFDYVPGTEPTNLENTVKDQTKHKSQSCYCNKHSRDQGTNND